MSNESTALAIVPRTIEEASSLSDRLAKASTLSDALRGKPADVLAAILAGQEMGLAPMASLRSIHVVKGKPILSADAMVGVVLGSGKAVYFRRASETEDAVTYETQRVGSPEPQRCTWTLAMAKRAGLDGDNWRKYPRAMLAARAKAELARDVYPDVLAGCYDDDDEARSFAPAPNLDRPTVTRRAEESAVIDAEVVEEPGVGVVDIEACETLAELESLAPKLAKLTGAAKDEARAAYKARKAQLSAPSEAA